MHHRTRRNRLQEIHQQLMSHRSMLGADDGRELFSVYIHDNFQGVWKFYVRTSADISSYFAHKRAPGAAFYSGLLHWNHGAFFAVAEHDYKRLDHKRVVAALFHAFVMALVPRHEGWRYETAESEG
jgi:hypothetical protein